MGLVRLRLWISESGVGILKIWMYVAGINTACKKAFPWQTIKNSASDDSRSILWDLLVWAIAAQLPQNLKSDLLQRRKSAQEDSRSLAAMKGSQSASSVDATEENQRLNQSEFTFQPN